MLHHQGYAIFLGKITLMDNSVKLIQKRMLGLENEASTIENYVFSLLSYAFSVVCPTVGNTPLMPAPHSR